MQINHLVPSTQEARLEEEKTTAPDLLLAIVGRLMNAPRKWRSLSPSVWPETHVTARQLRILL
jgi:hypothetical protein